MLRRLRQVGEIRQAVLLLLGRQEALHDVGRLMGRNNGAVSSIRLYWKNKKTGQGRFEFGVKETSQSPSRPTA